MVQSGACTLRFFQSQGPHKGARCTGAAAGSHPPLRKSTGRDIPNNPFQASLGQNKRVRRISGVMQSSGGQLAATKTSNAELQASLRQAKALADRHGNSLMCVPADITHSLS